MALKANLVDKYGVYDYKDPLIDFAIENHENWKHRELAIKMDHFARTYIVKLDEEIFTEKPIFTPDIFTQDDEEGPISEIWEKERLSDMFKKMKDLARTHSFCVVQLYNRKPFWRVFCDREITNIKYDARDNPISCTVEWMNNLKHSPRDRYHKENLNFYNEDKENNDGAALFVSFGVGQGNDLGEYDLKQIWSLIVNLRYMKLDIVNNSAKSSGFYHFLYGDGLKDDQKQDLLDTADSLGRLSGIGAKETLLKDIKSHYPEGSDFTIAALDEYLLLLSGATRLPLEFFRGERETGGMNSGFAGYVDEAKVNNKKKYVFGQFKRAIIKLIEMRFGIILEDVEIYIEEPEMDQIFMGGNQENNFGEEAENAD